MVEVLGALLLGGSWVVISGVLSPLIWAIAVVTLLITPLFSTPGPPSTVLEFGVHLRTMP